MQSGGVFTAAVKPGDMCHAVVSRRGWGGRGGGAIHDDPVAATLVD